MARLTAAERRKLPRKDFGGPGRSYPMPDAAHARNAKARASEMYHKGRLSKSALEKIDRKADRKLGRKSSRRSTRR